MRPATVCRTRVTATSISRFRRGGAALHDDHRAIIQITDGLSGLFPFLDHATRSSSPGSSTGLTAFASELTLRTGTPSTLATRLRLKSFVTSAAAFASQHHQLRVDLADLRKRILDDLHVHPRVLLEAGQDLQATPAAVAPEGVGVVGDPLELVEHDAGDDERPLQEARLRDVGDPSVDDRARVDRHLWLVGARRLLGRRPAKQPDRLRGNDEVVPLGDRQPGHPEAEEDGHAEREPRAERGRDGRERQAQEEPHHQAEHEPDHRRDELGRRKLLDPTDQPARGHDRQVWQDGEAHHEPGHQPGRDEGAGVGRIAERAPAAGHEREADEEPQRSAEEPNDADHGS